MKPKIGVCIHISEAVLPAPYFNHIEAIRYWGKQYPVMVFGTQRVKNFRARRVLTDEAISNECTHALFLDSDHIVPMNMLELFMENADAAMVSGLIVKRSHPYSVVAFIEGLDGELDDAHIKQNTGVHELVVCAMGCTLINLALLQKLKKPWWYDGRYRSDMNIGLKFRDELKARVLVDSRVATGHLGDPPIIYPGHADTIRAYEIKELLHETENRSSFKL